MANDAKTIKIGNHEYATVDVRQFTDVVLAVRVDGEYAKEYANMSDEDKKHNPRWKIGLVLASHSYFGFNSRKKTDIDDSNVIWVSEFDIRYALVTNELINKLYLTDILAGIEGAFNVLVGCVVTGYNIKYHKGTVPKYPYGENTQQTALEHDLAKTYPESIYFDMGAGKDAHNNTLKQRNAVIEYAGLAENRKWDGEDVVDTLEATDAIINLDDKTRSRLANKIDEIYHPKAEPDMAAMMQMMMKMMSGNK